MATSASPRGGSPRRSRRASLTRLWSIRFAVVLAAGLAVGAAAGVVGVNVLEPGRPSEPDSLQLLLDSIARGAPISTAPGAANGGAASPAVDDTSAPPPESIVVNDVNVPDLIGLEEGIARVSLHSADLTVGPIEFRPSESPVGTVLATVPVFGTPVARRTAITLVLSDGRSPVDTSGSFRRSTAR